MRQGRPGRLTSGTVRSWHLRCRPGRSGLRLLMGVDRKRYARLSSSQFDPKRTSSALGIKPIAAPNQFLWRRQNSLALIRTRLAIVGLNEACLSLGRDQNKQLVVNRGANIR
jgi:hypothetical protein